MGLGYSLKESFEKDEHGNSVAVVTVRSDEELTWRKLICALRDLADQLEEEHESDGEENYF